MIVTAAEVKASARIDDARLDAEIDALIATAQSMMEQECGLAVGALSNSSDPGAKRCAIALAALILDNPTAGRDEMHAILRSSLLDRARTWL